MKALLILTLTLLSTFSLLSQEKIKTEKDKPAKEEVGVKVDIGISKLETNLNDPFESEIYRFKTSPSFNFGIFYTHYFSARSSIGIEGLYSQINQLFEFDYITGINYSLTETAQTNIRISYFSFPIYYGYSTGKFTICGGMRFSLELENRIKTKSNATGTYHNGINYKTYDFGPTAGLKYALSERFSVDLNYYHGLQNLRDFRSVPDDLFWKVRQLTAGVRYAIK